MKRHNRVLTIAGSDSSGGAGIQADLKTFHTFGCYGMSAITAVTAQNTREVTAIHPIPVLIVSQQIAAVISDIGVDTIKIGMLLNADIIAAVAEALSSLKNTPIVLDPVMVATSGATLLEDTAITALQQLLFPLATIITPNLPEAEQLTGTKLTTKTEIEVAAKTLANSVKEAVLIKGGHLTDKQAADCLYLKTDATIHWLVAPRIDTPNTHGTGCTLAAAIAANLAQKHSLLEAVKIAKDYVTSVIKTGRHRDLPLR